MAGTKMILRKYKSSTNYLGLKHLEKVNIVAPFQYTIKLDHSLLMKDIAVSVFEYVGNRVLHDTVTFNNEDKVHFDSNHQFVTLDSRLRLQENYKYEFTSIEEREDYALFESEEIDLNNFVDFEFLRATEEDVQLKALPRAQVITQKNDVDLSGVKFIEEINWQVDTKKLGECLIALSFDEGRTWYGLHESSWIELDIFDIHAFYKNGIDAKNLHEINGTKYHLIRESSDKLRFAFLINRPSFDDQASSSSIKIYTSHAGEYIVADTKKYQYRYDVESKTLVFNFNEAGTYSFNYVDR
ncbi:hypothetical protein [Bacillus chungangensis]|uniref:Uncharacterized protein n=1 Tax=Bacillus chungangensis TaxID=587633 RepID=A0ABT9WTW8_9BACI|nr:hypothetical protein [Bacillus chungangensis]MDQ0176738.1 hypothetical protein [Bacillus chungangensis]